MRIGRTGTVVAAAVALSACAGVTERGGDGTSGTTGSPDGGAPDGGAPDGGSGTGRLPFVCPAGAAVQTGNNTITVGSASRTLIADIPQVAAGTRLAVVFNWHGVGDTAANWHASVPVNPSGDPQFPFILITPESTKLQPPAGLAWDMFQAGTGNLEIALVEAVLGCLQDAHELDLRHIHSVGFSGGAIVTNMLHSHFQEVFASTVALSGAWFNDSAEEALVDPTGQAAAFGMKPTLQWEALDPEFRGAVMLSRGGPGDQYGVAGVPILNFDSAVQAAVPFLKQNGRSSVVCAHSAGHQPPPGISVPMMVQFLKAHPRGTAGSAAPPGWPANCTFTAPDP